MNTEKTFTKKTIYLPPKGAVNGMCLEYQQVKEPTAAGVFVSFDQGETEVHLSKSENILVKAVSDIYYRSKYPQLSTQPKYNSSRWRYVLISIALHPQSLWKQILRK